MKKNLSNSEPVASQTNEKTKPQRSYQYESINIPRAQE